MSCTKCMSNKTSTCYCRPKRKIHYICDNELIKDCIQVDWNVPVLQSQIIYSAGGIEEIYGSGFVSYEDGDVPYVVVRFLLNGVQVGDSVVVYEDSSVAFNYTRFNAVEVSTPNVGVVEGSARGTLLITSRIPI